MTTTLVLHKDAYNAAALLGELFAAFPGLIASVSLDDGSVTLYLNGAPEPAQQAEAEAIVAGHDPAALTPNQEADAVGAVDVADLLGEIATQRAALQAALFAWETLGTPAQIAILKRDTAIIEKMLAVMAYMIRHWRF